MGAYHELQTYAMSQCSLWGVSMRIFSVVLLCAVPVAGIAQSVDSLDLKSKLRFHGESVYGRWSIAQSAVYAGILQGIGSPDEWGQGSGAYASASLLRSAAPRSMMFLPLAWIRRCIKTRDIFGRVAQGSGAEPAMRFAGPY